MEMQYLQNEFQKLMLFILSSAQIFIFQGIYFNFFLYLINNKFLYLINLINFYFYFYSLLVLLFC